MKNTLPKTLLNFPKPAILTEEQLGEIMADIRRALNARLIKKTDANLEAKTTQKAEKPSKIEKTANSKVKVRPMNNEWVGQEIKCLDGNIRTIVGTDEERRMYKARTPGTRGRPQLIPEALIESVKFKSGKMRLVERSLEQKMAA